MRDALLKRSRSAGPVLLVLDNVEGCEELLGEDDAFAKAFPSGFSERVSVNVVATARTCDVPLREDGWAQAFPLGDLSPEAALELLFADRKADTEEERKAAKRVAELLGCRALFLRRVPAILKGVNKKARIVCRTYAKLAEALERDALGTINKTGTVDQSYWPGRLWEIVQGNLAEWGLGEACVKLVKIASYFSPDGFPRQLLRHLWDRLVYPGLEDWGDAGEVFDQAVDLIKSYNLFQSVDPVRLHRLDRAAILQTAKAEPGLEDAIGAALESYGLLLKEDWAFLYEHEKIRAHVPEALAGDVGFWLSVMRSRPDLAEGCPWEKLDSWDWINLLRSQPQFADRCPWEKFDGGDWMWLLRRQPQFADRCHFFFFFKLDRGWCSLLCDQPQFADRCPWEALSDRHWAILLSAQPQFADRCPWDKLYLGRDWSILLRTQPQFADRCPWEKLNGMDWGHLLKVQPQFADRCPLEKRDGHYWCGVLCSLPQLADHCVWEKLCGRDWSTLLRAQPQFAHRCAWDKLSGTDWSDLLISQPQFADRCVWEKLGCRDWSRLLSVHPQLFECVDLKKLSGWSLSGLLCSQPQFADLCPCEKLGGRDWGVLLSSQPQFADRCAWEKLEGEDWGGLLRRQPQFADRCAWEKLNGEDWRSLLSEQPQFADKCDWEKLGGRDWLSLLSEQPQFAEKCSMEELSDRKGACWANISDDDFEMAWKRLIRVQPQFAKWREGQAK